MASSVFVNSASIAHKGQSNLQHLGPSVCITPPGSPLPIPIPYPTVSCAPELLSSYVAIIMELRAIA